MGFIKPEEVYLSANLYEPIQLTDPDMKKILNILFYKGTIKHHCNVCEKESVFNSVDNHEEYKQYGVNPPADYPEHNLRLFNLLLKNKYFMKEFFCTRDGRHSIVFIFYLMEDKLIKIGQFPSIFDLNDAKLNKYRKMLGEQRFFDFNKALELGTNGLGIGSWIYLKRTFEWLIEECYNNSKINIDEQTFKKLYIENKIIELKEYLPSFLYENSQVYNILNKNVESLTEEECLKAFLFIKIGIELILDEKL